MTMWPILVIRRVDLGSLESAKLIIGIILFLINNW